MKNILVMTNFSRNSVHAGESAAWLAEKMHTELRLWNCYPKVPVMPGYLGGTLVTELLAGPEEAKDLLEQNLIYLEDYITSTNEKYKPRMSTGYREGSLQEALQQELNEEEFEMIVIGAASADCNIEHIFTGSDTYKIIETANCPVLIVPLKAGLYQLNKVVFATNFDLHDLEAIRYLINLSDVFRFKIEVVHIALSGENDDAMISNESAFIAKLLTFKNVLAYKEIRGKELTSRLNRISKQTGADILAMTHHQYNLLKRVITDSAAKKELADQKIPLLLFPIKEK